MSVAEMQACLARIYVDGAVRHLMRLDPEFVLADYRLTAEERDVLLHLDEAGVASFAASLHRKRRAALRGVFPLLLGLKFEPVDRHLKRFLQIYVVRPDSSPLDEIDQFGRYMAESLSLEDEIPRYCADVAQYERLSFHASSVSVAAASPELGPDDAPSLCPGVGVGIFQTAVVDVIESLGAGRPPVDSLAPCTVVIRSDGPVLVNEATSRLLDMCDGHMSVRDMAVREERRLGRPALLEPILTALRVLTTEGVLTATAQGATTLHIDPEPWIAEGH